MAGKVDVKVVLLGKAFVGKTSLVQRFVNDNFPGDNGAPYQNTIGGAFASKRLFVNGNSIVLGIWDTAGNERYEAMCRMYYRGAKAAIICYDLTERTSFERAAFWIEEIQNNEDKCRLYLCGTKKDLLEHGSRRQVFYHDAVGYVRGTGAQVFETSSRSGENIRELFHKIGEDFIKDQLGHQMVDGTNDIIKLKADSSSHKRHNCCRK